MSEFPIKNPNQTGTGTSGNVGSTENRTNLSGSSSTPKPSVGVTGSPAMPRPGHTGTGVQNSSSPPKPPQSVADQALAVGHDLKDNAAELAGSTTDALKDQAAHFVDAAKDIASQTGDKIQEKVNDQKGAGAEYVGNLANTLRRAAHEFESEIPIAATYIRKAASQVDSVAATVRTGNFNDLVRGAQSFAKKQPTAFLGLAVLAGFGVVRFLKSSSDITDQSEGSSSASIDRHNRPATSTPSSSTGY